MFWLFRWRLFYFDVVYYCYYIILSPSLSLSQFAGGLLDYSLVCFHCMITEIIWVIIVVLLLIMILLIIVQHLSLASCYDDVRYYFPMFGARTWTCSSWLVQDMFWLQSFVSLTWAENMESSHREPVPWCWLFIDWGSTDSWLTKVPMAFYGLNHLSPPF